MAARSEIASPGAEIDAAENDFFVAGAREAADFVEDGFGREAAASSADEGDNAEGAAVVAAILNFQGGAGVIPFAAEDWRDEDVLLLEDIADENGSGGEGERLERNKIWTGWGARGWRRNEIGDLRFVGIADDEGDSREGGNFVWSALRVAAGYDDAGVGIGGVEFADGVTGLGVGGSGYRASVENDDVGNVRRGGRGAAAVEKLALDGGTIGLGGAASELLDGEGRHDKGSLPSTVYSSQRRVVRSKVRQRCRAGQPRTPLPHPAVPKSMKTIGRENMEK